MPGAQVRAGGVVRIDAADDQDGAGDQSGQAGRRGQDEHGAGDGDPRPRPHRVPPAHRRAREAAPPVPLVPCDSHGGREEGQRDAEEQAVLGRDRVQVTGTGRRDERAVVIVEVPVLPLVVFGLADQ